MVERFGFSCELVHKNSHVLSDYSAFNALAPFSAKPYSDLDLTRLSRPSRSTTIAIRTSGAGTRCHRVRMPLKPDLVGRAATDEAFSRIVRQSSCQPGLHTPRLGFHTPLGRVAPEFPPTVASDRPGRKQLRACNAFSVIPAKAGIQRCRKTGRHAPRRPLSRGRREEHKSIEAGSIAQRSNRIPCASGSSFE
jgi:hypothetical protein